LYCMNSKFIGHTNNSEQENIELYII